MKYVYPAIFTLDKDGYDVSFPDLFGCHTCGSNFAEAIEMAEDASAMWLWLSEENNDPIPNSSTSVEVSSPSFVSFIVADTDAYRRQLDSRAVKKTLTIPAWLNYQAEKAHVNFSGILQDALIDKLQLSKPN